MNSYVSQSADASDTMPVSTMCPLFPATPSSTSSLIASTGRALKVRFSLSRGARYYSSIAHAEWHPHDTCRARIRYGAQILVMTNE